MPLGEGNCYYQWVYGLLPISHTLAKDRKDDGFRRNYVMFLEGKSVPDEIELNLLDGANEIRQRS